MRTSRACFLALALCAAGAQAATLELLSRAPTAADSIGLTTEPALSADGRYVAFRSSAPNLAPGQEDDNGSFDVFLHDRVLGTTTLVTHAPGFPSRAASPAVPGEYGSLDISADGRYVVFSGRGLNLVPGASGNPLDWNVFLWDRVTDTTTLVSHAAGSPNTAADGSSFFARLSADGNFVVFSSLAPNLVPGQVDSSNPFGGTTTDVFLWNRAADTTTLVSRRSGTVIAGNQASFAPVISADGNVVVFLSLATDLLPAVNDSNQTADVYAWQRSTDTLSLVSRVAASPQVAAGDSAHEGLAVSDDGRYVAFASGARNLIPGLVDDSSGGDAFLYDRATGEMRLASHRSASPLRTGGIADAASVTMSADGRYVAFVSGATDLVPGQVDPQSPHQALDVFVYDRVTGSVTLASHRHDSITTAGSLGSPGAFSLFGTPSFSADGRFLAFHSAAVDLVAGQTDVPNTPDVFLYETASQSVTLVSRTRASASAAGNQRSFSPLLSADGSVAVFLSEATNLGEGQTDPYGFTDLFFYQRASGEITSASRRDSDLPPPVTALFSDNVLGGLSADGRYAVFESLGDVFLRDTVADTTTRISPPPAFPGGDTSSREAVLSADGRFAAFITIQLSATGLSGGSYLYLYDRAAGTLTLVNHAPGPVPPGGQPDGSPASPALSADGRFVAYQCRACGLIPEHRSTVEEIFLYDRLSGLNTLVSRAANTSLPAFPPDGNSAYPAISADGRHVVFWSYASNLVPGQIDFLNTPDLFVFDREAGPAGATALGSTSLITHRPGFPERSATTLAPSSSSALAPAVLSEDGRFIVFQSGQPNLVEGQIDTNGGADVFLYNQGTRANTLISHAASSPIPAILAGNGPSSTSSFSLVSGTISMSADGRFIAYESLATDLAAGAGDTNGVQDVFVYDRLLGTHTLVSYNGGAPLTAANGASGIPRLSADGRRVAFLSTAADLVPGQTLSTGWYNLYVQDHGSGARTFIARAFRNPRPFAPFPSDGPIDDPRSFVPHLSANGRLLGFNSEAGLVPGDYNGTWDVYLWDQDGVVDPEEPEEPEGPIAVTPCRLLDTRRRAERPVLTSNLRRVVTAHDRCGVPDTAKQVVVNVTVFNPSGKGNLRFYAGEVTLTAPPAGILRFERGATRTETFTLPLGPRGTLTILPFVANRGTVHVAVEVTAYEK